VTNDPGRFANLEVTLTEECDHWTKSSVQEMQFINFHSAFNLKPNMIAVGIPKYLQKPLETKVSAMINAGIKSNCCC